MFDLCPQLAPQLARGLGRALDGLGFAHLTEFPLPDGRRADVAALGGDGAIWIIEIKTSAADFRADAKWTDYEAWCDRFYFATPDGFPDDLLPPDRGLFRADAYDAVELRPATEAKLKAARRAALTRRFAKTAAERLARMTDPGGPFSAW
ncbi:MAG: MmcB family DNA repair protein [Pseudomonadota bacterium]